MIERQNDLNALGDWPMKDTHLRGLGWDIYIPSSLRIRSVEKQKCISRSSNSLLMSIYQEPRSCAILSYPPIQTLHFQVLMNTFLDGNNFG